MPPRDDPAALEVRRATIGRGVFATRRLRRGRLCEIRGRVVAGDDAPRDYFALGEGLALVPESPYRYLNHACEPNAEVVEVEEPSGRLRLWLYALRPIAPEEELTIDYGWDADSAIPCRCGSARCRGWVVAADAAGALR